MPAPEAAGAGERLTPGLASCLVGGEPQRGPHAGSGGGRLVLQAGEGLPQGVLELHGQRQHQHLELGAGQGEAPAEPQHRVVVLPVPRERLGGCEAVVQLPERAVGGRVVSTVRGSEDGVGLGLGRGQAGGPVGHGPSRQPLQAGQAHHPQPHPGQEGPRARPVAPAQEAGCRGSLRLTSGSLAGHVPALARLQLQRQRDVDAPEGGVVLVARIVVAALVRSAPLRHLHARLGRPEA